MGVNWGRFLFYCFVFGIPAILMDSMLENIIKSRKAKAKGENDKKYMKSAIFYLAAFLFLLGFYGLIYISLYVTVSRM